MYFPATGKYLLGFPLNAVDLTHLLRCSAGHLKHITALSQAIHRA